MGATWPPVKVCVRLVLSRKRESLRGHHVYKAVWIPVIGEELLLRAEDNNEHDNHAVAVIKGSNVICHILWSISTAAWFFLKREGNITCHITGKHKLGVGLEVPCVYTFSGSIKALDKLSRPFSGKSHPHVQNDSCPQ